MAEYKTAEAVMQRNLKGLMAFPNVVAVGIGYRQQGGEETEQLCISVSVSRKLPDDELAPGGRLPDSLEGVPVDVVETGELGAQ
jgi:hypothetical protein